MSPHLQSFPANFRALVVGVSGAIGNALVDALRSDAAAPTVLGLHRRSVPPVDFDDPDTVARAAAALEGEAPFHLIVIATGVLHRAEGPRGAAQRPEKRLADLDAAAMLAAFQANTVGPALVLRHFAPRLDVQRGVLAVLSAKVGSIGDNRLGGWYSYRASKAALNMVVKTAAIECARRQPNAVLVALHPGTVRSALSQPFNGETLGRAPATAAAQMLSKKEPNSL